MKNMIFVFMLVCSYLIYAQTAIAPLVGDGTAGSPYEIATLENLYWIAASDDIVPNPNSQERWSSHYIQTADIDATSTSAWFPDGSGGYYGWTPIGTSSLMFTGSYDGNDFIIQSLYIKREGVDNIGLFAFMNGSLSNMGLVDNDVTGRYNTAALCGKSYGTVDNCYATGLTAGYERSGGLIGDAWTNSVTTNSFTSGTVSGTGGTSISGLTGFNRGQIANCYSDAEINGHGGLVGVNSGTVENSYATGSLYGGSSVGGFAGRNSGSITNCYSTGAAGGNNTGDVGGFVGFNQSAGVIAQCYTLGNATGGHNAGGFAGKNEGTIYKCSASGEVTGSTPFWANRTGGFVGHNRYGSITDCYARGNVNRDHNYTDQLRFGGFVGINEQGGIIHSYSTGAISFGFSNNGFAGSVVTGGNYEMSGNFWDIDTSGQTSSAGEATGKTTLEMKTQSTFTNWDFETIWNLFFSINNGYPFLQWQFPAPAAPENVQISINEGMVTITWNEVPDATSYKIYSSDAPDGEFTEETVGISNNTTWSSTIGDSNKFYHVRAVKSRKQ